MLMLQQVLTVFAMCVINDYILFWPLFTIIANGTS